VLGGRESVHVDTGVGNDHVCDQGADPGDGADEFAEPLKRLDHHLDPLGQLVDRRGVPVDQIQVHACEERVVLVEPAVKRLSELGDLRPQPPLGQLRQRGGIAVAGDERLQHRPTGDAQDVGGDRGQLDSRILQELFQPLRFPRTFPSDSGACSSQVA